MDFKLGNYQRSGVASWFVKNPVAANLLMLAIIGFGVIAFKNIRLESVPVFPSKYISVTVAHNGGTPEDIEKGVVEKIEQALNGIEGIKSISSYAGEGEAVVTIEKKDFHNIADLMSQVKSKIDSVSNLPEEAELPEITQIIQKNRVVWISLRNKVTNDQALNKAAIALRRALLRGENITDVTFFGNKERELGIYITEEDLNKYKLTFEEVAAAIQASSIRIGAGSLKTSNGEIRLFLDEEAKSNLDYHAIVVRTDGFGNKLYLGEIAQISDGFADRNVVSLYNGEPSIMLEVNTGGQTDIVKAYEEAVSIVSEFKESLPSGIEIQLWNNSSEEVADRLSFLAGNGLLAMLFVLVVLALFLDIRLAFWVAIGIPVSFAGALAVMPLSVFDISLNSVTLFAFILVLGIVVDDAIIVSESIFSAKERLGNTVNSTIVGVREVLVVATFGVLTTVVAFLPLTRISSEIGQMLGQVAWVVVFCLIFSIIGSKLILPAHLRGIEVKKTSESIWGKAQLYTRQTLNNICHYVYKPLLIRSLEYRYFTILLFIAFLFLSVGIIKAGFVKEVFFPDVEQEFIQATVEMQSNLSSDEVLKVAERISQALRRVSVEYTAIEGVDDAPVKSIYSLANMYEINIIAELSRADKRDISGNELSDMWRREVGPIQGAIYSRFQEEVNDIEIELYSDDLEELRQASESLESQLSQYTAIKDVFRDVKEDREEMKISLTPEGRALGITNQQLSSQVRSAFYGLEVQKNLEGGEEVTVMLKYPEENRKSVSSVYNLRIKSNEGEFYTFETVANLELQKGLNSINREDGRRVIIVGANVDKTKYSPYDIIEELEYVYLPSFKEKYPSVEFLFSGDSEEGDTATQSLAQALMVSILLIYILLAVPLKSYLQPLMIMSVIPFGMVGAVFGHLIMGLPFSILSYFGILALSGVVVNDSLILISTINRKVKKCDYSLAVITSALSRFRPVILTSATTFVGLMPIIFETSYQAQFLIPTAVSLGFGIIFSTLTTLFFVPSLCVFFKDLKTLMFRNNFHSTKTQQSSINVS